MTRSLTGALCLVCALLPAAATGQVNVERQIDDAVLPLPQELRSGAMVLGYLSGDTLEMLRQGTNGYTCLADAPGNDRFHVSCYESGLDAFMARGRELRSEGMGTTQVREIRRAEMESGSLTIPDGAKLYQLFGAINPATGRPDSVSELTVVYHPFGTEESTGVSTQQSRTEPWLMDAGQHRAHVMVPGGTRKYP
jgi:hypothetical protein